MNGLGATNTSDDNLPGASVMEFKPKKKHVMPREGFRRIWVKYGQKKVTGKTSAFEGWTTQCRYYKCFTKDCPAKRHILKPLENIKGDDGATPPENIVQVLYS